MKAIDLIPYCTTHQELDDLKDTEVEKYKSGSISKDEIQSFIKEAFAYRDNIAY